MRLTRKRHNNRQRSLAGRSGRRSATRDSFPGGEPLSAAAVTFIRRAAGPLSAAHAVDDQQLEGAEVPPQTQALHNHIPKWRRGSRLGLSIVDG